jgi:hypothetical protein
MASSVVTIYNAANLKPIQKIAFDFTVPQSVKPNSNSILKILCQLFSLKTLIVHILQCS